MLLTIIHLFDYIETEDDRKRLVEIHELVNRLPDPNYLTLRYLVAHLDR